MRRLIVPIIAAVVLLTGCGTSAAERASQATSARASAQGYPVEVVSCGIPLRLDAPPSKVLVLGETGFSNLAALGLVDRVALRAGVAHFDSAAPDLQATYDAIPAVDAGRGENGAVILSTEVALKAGVDLVIGYDKGVDREALTKAGIKLYSPEAYCPTYAGGKASWHLVEEELTKLATIFGRPQNARRAIDDLRAKADQLRSQTGAARGSAAALYMPAGATKLRVYGVSSMIQPILEANALTNAYADNTKRVFDLSMEDLLARNPDWIVLLSSDADEEQTLKTFTSFNGAAQLKAVERNQVVVIPFVLTDPPNVLSVKGATMLSEKLKTK